jgi:hypothetical protein
MAAMTTLVAVVGSGAATVISAAADLAANVTMETVGDVPDRPLEAASSITETWSRARRHGSVYTLVDVDPIGAVVTEWARRLRGEDNDLEVAIGTAAGTLPDYYLVARELPDPEIHWYLGLVRSLSASRVLATDLHPRGVLDTLASLPSGKELPTAAALALQARLWVPLPELTGAGRLLTS